MQTGTWRALQLCIRNPHAIVTLGSHPGSTAHHGSIFPLAPCAPVIVLLYSGGWSKYEADTVVRSEESTTP